MANFGICPTKLYILFQNSILYSMAEKIKAYWQKLSTCAKTKPFLYKLTAMIIGLDISLLTIKSCKVSSKTSVTHVSLALVQSMAKINYSSRLY